MLSQLMKAILKMGVKKASGDDRGTILRFLGNAPLVSGGTNYAEGASAILPAGPPTG